MTSELSAFKKSLIIVISEFNEPIIENLLQGAKDAFVHYGGKKSDLTIYRVPGAFEIPGTIQKILTSQDSDAIVALGAIIRGETPHFDYVARESAQGIAELSRNARIPIINGVITTNNVIQAKARSKVGGKNKGWESIEAALQTISVYQKILSTSKR